MNAALRQHSREIRNFEGDAQERTELINKLRSTFLIKVDESDKVTINITTSDKSESIQILETALNLISKTVKHEKESELVSVLGSAGIEPKSKIA